MRGLRRGSRAGLSRSVLLDVLLATVFTVVAQVDVWAPHLAVWDDDPVEGSRLVSSLLLLGVGVPLAWRRRAPLTTVTLVATAAAAQAVATGTAPIGLLLAGPTLIALYSVAAYGDRPRALVGLAVMAGAIAVHDLNDPNIRSAADVGEASYWWLVMLIGWIVGRYVGSRRAAEVFSRRASRLEAERQATEAAVRDERARIARELHDVVAHSVSVVAVQAGAAQSVLDTDPKRAREPLDAIESTAREALTEMRRLLGVLRAEDDGPALSPQPGLADVETLIGHVREAGLPVDLIIEGEPRALPLGVELSAFRIIQEALTNVMRHAGTARAWVTVRYGADAVDVQVVDDGRAGGAHRPGGHGLVGMRERVALYGGTLSAGEQPEGGFAVSAMLPIGSPPA